VIPISLYFLSDGENAESYEKNQAKRWCDDQQQKSG
jgi:hypothetical protein